MLMLDGSLGANGSFNVTTNVECITRRVRDAASIGCCFSFISGVLGDVHGLAARALNCHRSYISLLHVRHAANRAFQTFKVRQQIAGERTLLPFVEFADPSC